ncbi:hypothetical protein J14TS5_00680 [Paenibacillus lautus]|jgi:hypothetical protein|nr:hypothetical protein J14TS5_00680 [Paenibacillus lautus]
MAALQYLGAVIYYLWKHANGGRTNSRIFDAKEPTSKRRIYDRIEEVYFWATGGA